MHMTCHEKWKAFTDIWYAHLPWKIMMWSNWLISGPRSLQSMWAPSSIMKGACSLHVKITQIKFPTIEYTQTKLHFASCMHIALLVESHVFEFKNTHYTHTHIQATLISYAISSNVYIPQVNRPALLALLYSIMNGIQTALSPASKQLSIAGCRHDIMSAMDYHSWHIGFSNGTCFALRKAMGPNCIELSLQKNAQLTTHRPRNSSYQLH